MLRRFGRSTGRVSKVFAGAFELWSDDLSGRCGWHAVPPTGTRCDFDPAQRKVGFPHHQRTTHTARPCPPLHLPLPLAASAISDQAIEADCAANPSPLGSLHRILPRSDHNPPLLPQ
jgi:hypothetical protein